MEVEVIKKNEKISRTSIQTMLGYNDFLYCLSRRNTLIPVQMHPNSIKKFLIASPKFRSMNLLKLSEICERKINSQTRDFPKRNQNNRRI